MRASARTTPAPSGLATALSRNRLRKSRAGDDAMSEAMKSDALPIDAANPAPVLKNAVLRGTLGAPNRLIRCCPSAAMAGPGASACYGNDGPSQLVRSRDSAGHA